MDSTPFFLSHHLDSRPSSGVRCSHQAQRGAETKLKRRHQLSRREGMLRVKILPQTARRALPGDGFKIILTHVNRT